MAINEEDFLNELDFCLRHNDMVKAKALLQFASDSDISPDLQKKAMGYLARGPENMVFPLLEYLTHLTISDSSVQDSIYELILDKAYGNTDLLLEYIRTGKEKRTRILFLQAAGDLMLAPAFDELAEILFRETDKNILLTAITSMGKLQLPKGIAPLTAMAQNPDRDIRMNAILAIGRISTPEAVEALAGFLDTDEQTSKMAVEAMAEIQNLNALQKITSLLDSADTLIRDTAIDQLMKMGNKATPIITRAFQDANPDYLIHLITTLGYIGDTAAVPSLVSIINTQPENANIRQAVYEAMERIPSQKTAICLAQGLQDPVEAVRMSAARAIDKNLSKPLIAGLKNIIRDDSNGALNAVEALIDSDASNTCRFLTEESAFMENAKKHISTKADPATRASFIKLMEELGKKDMIKDLPETDSVPQAQDTESIVVIDDSKMMLKLYQNKLHALGYSPRVFHLPEEAISHILQTKPSLIITDLNMPNISGIELTREVRKKFTKTQLPILMITTQSDFTVDDMVNVQQTEKNFSQSGINKILYKPFTDEQLKEAVTGFLKNS